MKKIRPLLVSLSDSLSLYFRIKNKMKILKERQFGRKESANQESSPLFESLVLPNFARNGFAVS